VLDTIQSNTVRIIEQQRKKKGFSYTQKGLQRFLSFLDGKSLVPQYWRTRLAPPAAKPNRLIPVTITRSAPARVHIGSQVSIELSSEHLPDLLLALG
jgi:hypothetical protein